MFNNIEIPSFLFLKQSHLATFLFLKPIDPIFKVTYLNLITLPSNQRINLNVIAQILHLIPIMLLLLRLNSLILFIHFLFNLLHRHMVLLGPHLQFLLILLFDFMLRIRLDVQESECVCYQCAFYVLVHFRVVVEAWALVYFQEPWS